jgi:uncharacterized membrane protein HdeD (DUF308 family)
METAGVWSFETKKYPWWLLLLGGCLSVITGILLLTIPGRTIVALAWALGLYWLIQGIFTLVGMFVEPSAWGWKLFIGILGILAGIVVMRHPIASAAAISSLVVLLLGIQGVVVGIVRVGMAFKGGGWGVGILGALSVVFGIILILNSATLSMVVALVWIAAILALVGGIVQIIHAFQVWKA